jgi:hypothetical protein
MRTGLQTDVDSVANKLRGLDGSQPDHTDQMTGLEVANRDQRFWSIHRFAFLRATLSASLQLLQISADSPFTVVSSSWCPTDLDMRARGNQRASTRLWEQTLIL